jgi:hypothetical protein
MNPAGHVTGSIIVAATLFAATSAIAQTPSWTVPPDSARCPSKWGAGDERGAGNLMGPKTVLNAVKFIKTGEVIELSHVLHEGMPISRMWRYEVFTKRTTEYLGTNRRGSNEELVVSEIGQVGTQFNASPTRPTKTRSTTASRWTTSRPAPDSRSSASKK